MQALAERYITEAEYWALEEQSLIKHEYDQGEKFDHYKQLPLLREYLLVWQDRVRVDCYRRLESGDWLLHTAQTLESSITLQSIHCTLPLAELYEDVELPDTPRPLREPTSEPHAES